MDAEVERWNEEEEDVDAGAEDVEEDEAGESDRLFPGWWGGGANLLKLEASKALVVRFSRSREHEVSL